MFKKLLWVLMFLSSIQCASGQEVMSLWLEVAIDKADQLNLKDPNLALNHLLEVREQHPSIDKNDKYFLNAHLARNYYELGDFNKALGLIDEIYQIYPDVEGETGIRLIRLHGLILSDQGEVDKGITLIKKSINLAEKEEDQNSLAQSYNAIAYIHANYHNDVESLTYYQKAYDIIIRENDPVTVAYQQQNLAVAFYYLNDHEQALINISAAIQFFEDQELHYDQLFAVQRLGDIYLKRKEFRLAINAYQKAIQLSEKVSDKQMAYYPYLGLAEANLALNEYSKAKQNLDLASPLQDVNQSFNILIMHQIIQAKIFLGLNEISAAKLAIAKAVKLGSKLDETTDTSVLINLAEAKALLASKSNNFESAFQHQKEIRVLEQSYQNSVRELARSRYKVIFDTEKAQLENKLLNKENLVNKIQLEQATSIQLYQRFIIAIFIVFVLIFLLLLRKQISTNKYLEKISNTDALTQLPNRRYIFSLAEKINLRSKTMHLPMSMILFDIDFFKKVNDTYGHDVGDKVLVSIAQELSKHLRAFDTLGRVGGEEFLVILDRTSLNKALQIAERLRQAIEEIDILTAEHSIKITASFGVTEQKEGVQTCQQLYKLADEALYKAKGTGRNKVVSI